MVLLLIAVNLVLLVALAALWESWRSRRRTRRQTEPGRLTLRIGTRPSDAGLVEALLDGAGDLPGPVAPPVWGDRYTLVEGPGDDVVDLLGRVVGSALDAGFRIRYQRARKVGLRRGLRLLTMEVGPA